MDASDHLLDRLMAKTSHWKMLLFMLFQLSINEEKKKEEKYDCPFTFYPFTVTTLFQIDTVGISVF